MRRTFLAAADAVPAKHLNKTVDWKPCFPGQLPPGLPPGSEGLDNTVESFIVDGAVPGHDPTCAGVPLPVPGQAAPSGLATAAAYRAAAGSLPS